MTSFIHDVLAHLKANGVDLSQLSFILPSRRAGIFLKHELSSLIEHPLFAPEIISIEEFVAELADLKQLSTIELLFEFYSVYKDFTPKDEIQPFDDFVKWAQVALQDFNEIDRFLVDPDHIFDYLVAVDEINHWSLESNQTPLIKSYLNFWDHLKTLYHNFYTHLQKKGTGYQGLLYREAVENLGNYIQLNNSKQHIFIGFNALNKAEIAIIQELLHSDMAEIFWDIDRTFLEHENHDAGHFMREHMNSWRYFQTHKFNWVHELYAEGKNINIIGTPKNVGQAKYVGELLRKINSKSGPLKSTAVVLSDENLLMPVLNSIPSEIDALNITMGFPLKSIPLTSLFELLFAIHKDGKSSFYYKDVIALLSHQFVQPLFQTSSGNQANTIIKTIQKNNLVFLTQHKLEKLLLESNSFVNILFSSWPNPNVAIEHCQKLIMKIKASFEKDAALNALALEYLFKFNEIFNTIFKLNHEHNHVTSIKGLFELFKELLYSETLDFQGEPLQGLQIMGMLESRVLDFDTVIIASVNEGILPAGKSSNSFIPFDIKLENNLPTYKEKDAVYAYHFYRLIQRAKHVYIIYNTEPDALNAGEKSRFITQLEIDQHHDINPQIVAPLLPNVNDSLRRIKKTDSVIKRIESVFQKGLSPSSLLNYIRNPIDFYAQKLLETEEFDDVEEIVEAKTLGTVIHETLKELYEPYKGSALNLEKLDNSIEKTDAIVVQQFKKYYNEGELDRGKNLIILEVAKQYIKNFLKKEKQLLKKGNTLKILELEIDVETTINVNTIPFPIRLKGQIDRIDELNGVLRIIDYKTGKVERPQVEIVNWNDITSDYKKNGVAFQVLMYAFIMNQKSPFKTPIEAGIISFKNLKSGFLSFSKKDKSGNGATKNTLITQEFLNAFQEELETLIFEIYDKNIDFIEKEIS
ncbi:MAG: PD-(D/E)XK nuclease family protein [Flavobacteriaceae bacterium]|nr:PD-(D/E)XK nuclease family protein [Flavobacteriaceae bacterium]